MSGIALATRLATHRRSPRRTLILEQGGVHHGETPLPIAQGSGHAKGGERSSSHSTHFMSVPAAVGGGCSAWSGWSPWPTQLELSPWCDEVRRIARRYRSEASSLLGVKEFEAPSGCILSELIGTIASRAHALLDARSAVVGCDVSADPAPLAVGREGRPTSALDVLNSKLAYKPSDPKDLSDVRIVTHARVVGVLEPGPVRGAQILVQTPSRRVLLSLPKHSVVAFACGALETVGLLWDYYRPASGKQLSFGGHAVDDLNLHFNAPEGLWRDDESGSTAYLLLRSSTRKGRSFQVQLSCALLPRLGVNRIEHPGCAAPRILRAHIGGLAEVRGSTDARLHPVLKVKSDGFRQTSPSSCVVDVRPSPEDAEAYCCMKSLMANLGVELKRILKRAGMFALPSGTDGDARLLVDSPAGLVHASGSFPMGNMGFTSCVGLDGRLHAFPAAMPLGFSLFQTPGAHNGTVVSVALSLHVADSCF